MTSSAVRTFLEPDDYAASIRVARTEMTVIGGGHFRARLTDINLHRLWMQRFSESLARVTHSFHPRGQAI